MELGVVSAGAISGMIFSLSIAVFLPIVLILVAKNKYNAKISTFFIGAGTFILFAMILEQILHSVVIGSLGQEKMMSNLWLYAIYGATAAAMFEETGRYIAMKFWMKKRLNRSNAFMYGIGHGGGEAIIIVGLTCVNNIITSVAINTGLIQPTLALLDEETRALTFEQISQLWTLPAYQFYFAGIERISAITTQIALSFFIYKGIKSEKRYFIYISYLIHFIVDFVSVILAQYASIVVVELAVLAIADAVAWAAYKINKEEENGTSEES